MAASKNEVAAPAVEEQVWSLPAEFTGDAGAGLENVDKDSVAIPFLIVLQKLSPQVEETDAKYVEGSKAGMFLNTVTEGLLDGKEGVHFLPCAFQRRFLRWGARGTENSGFKGEYTVEQAAAMRESGEVVEFEGKLFFPMSDGVIDPKKCDKLSDTRNHFGLLVGADGIPSPVLLSLASTQIKKSKQLIALLGQVKVKNAAGAMVTPPSWVNKMHITTVLEQNDKGNWYGVRIAPAGFVQDPALYNVGKEFHALVSSGDVAVNYDAAASEGDGGSEGGF